MEKPGRDEERGFLKIKENVETYGFQIGWHSYRMGVGEQIRLHLEKDMVERWLNVLNAYFKEISTYFKKLGWVLAIFCLSPQVHPLHFTKQDGEGRRWIWRPDLYALH